MSKRRDEGVLTIYVIGLIISAVCVGELIGAIYGWLVVGIGLMTVASFAFVVNAMEDIAKSKVKEE